MSFNTSASSRTGGVSLIIPTYNERGNLPLLVERIAKCLNHCQYEVIVVDDGSPDGTAEVATELSHKYPVRVIRRLSEKGLASAVVAGFKNSEAQVLGVMDADPQHLRWRKP